jgi:hypothetical protein
MPASDAQHSSNELEEAHKAALTCLGAVWDLTLWQNTFSKWALAVARGQELHTDLLKNVKKRLADPLGALHRSVIAGQKALRAVRTEFTVAAKGRRGVAGSFTRPNAHEAVLAFAEQVFHRIWSQADPDGYHRAIPESKHWADPSQFNLNATVAGWDAACRAVCPTLDYDQEKELELQCEEEYAAASHASRDKAGADRVKPAGEAVTPPAPAATEEFIFAPSGNGYLIMGFGESGHLSGYKGLHDIARIIRTPGEAVSMLELVEAGDRTKADQRSTQEALDVQAMKEVKEKLDERRRDLDRAREENNSLEVDLAEKDIEELRRQVRQAKWFGGKAGAGKGFGCKDRDLNNLFDKLRPAIHNRLKAVYAALRQAKPAMSLLADHFEQSISSEGGTFVYRPGRLVPVWKHSQK